RRGTDEPWLLFSGDSLLVGDVGRPDLHVAGGAHGQARLLHDSLQRLLGLPDHIVLYPSHYGGSVCGRRLSRNPFSSGGFDRAPTLLPPPPGPGRSPADPPAGGPPPPADQQRIVAANRAGNAGAPA